MRGKVTKDKEKQTRGETEKRGKERMMKHERNERKVENVEENRLRKEEAGILKQRGTKNKREVKQ